MGAALKQEASTPKVIVRKVVSADLDKVFDAWTDPRLMERWLFPRGGSAKSSNELRVGGSYSHVMHLKNAEGDCCRGTRNSDGSFSYPHGGEYLEIVRPSRLVFTWNSPSVTNTRVTVELRAVQGGTEVTVTHELLGTEEQRKGHTEGWQECLASLAEYFGQRG